MALHVVSLVRTVNLTYARDLRIMIHPHSDQINLYYCLRVAISTSSGSLSWANRRGFCGNYHYSWCPLPVLATASLHALPVFLSRPIQSAGHSMRAPLKPLLPKPADGPQNSQAAQASRPTQKRKTVPLARHRHK